MDELTDDELQRCLEGADLGQEKAEALATKLTAETGKRHYAEQCSFMGLVGGAVWWEVRRSILWLFYTEVASFWAPDGVVRS